MLSTCPSRCVLVNVLFKHCEHFAYMKSLTCLSMMCADPLYLWLYLWLIITTYCFLQFVEPSGKRFLLAIDVSGSMTGYNVLGSTSVDCRVASAAMAMVTARTEANYHMVGFSHHLVPININAKMSLTDVCHTISRVCCLYQYATV